MQVVGFFLQDVMPVQKVGFFFAEKKFFLSGWGLK